jgi:hypothetical protein
MAPLAQPMESYAQDAANILEIKTDSARYAAEKAFRNIVLSALSRSEVQAIMMRAREV